MNGEGYFWKELKSWGHPGGVSHALIMKSDGERSIIVVREAVAVGSEVAAVEFVFVFAVVVSRIRRRSCLPRWRVGDFGGSRRCCGSSLLFYCWPAR